jgi:hypothetical protein
LPSLCRSKAYKRLPNLPLCQNTLQKKITSLFENTLQKNHKSFRKTLQKITSLFPQILGEKDFEEKKKKRDFARKQAKTLPPNTPPSSSQAKARSLWGY